MIKRIIACLTICFIITGIISPVFSHAEPIPIYTPNWNDPGIAEIINISDLTGWMANGGVFDITSFQNLDEFLTWYFKIRVPVQDENGNITFAPTYGYDTYLDSNYSSPRFIEQSNIRGMIARSYQNKTGYGRRLQEQVDKALLEDGDLSNVNIPLLNQAESAFFVGYNTNAINFYRNQFNSDEPDIETFLPSNYQWVSNINSLLSNNVNLLSDNYYLNNIHLNYIGNFDSDSVYGYSFGSNNNTTRNISNFTKLSFNDGTITINVTSGSPTIVSYSNFNIKTLGNSFSNMDSRFTSLSATSGSGNNNQIIINGVDNYQSLTTSFTNLSTAISYIYEHFCNINLYVDNVCWINLNSTSQTIVPEFPDIVGGDELPVNTWPLTVPKAPSYINLPGLRQAFQRAKNTDNQFDILDLKDSLVDPEGDPIVDPEMETVPIPLPNPDPINPEVIPELPNLPLIPPANNPGFSGVSVLAEIINFTNQSLPSALITVFWGIVFGAVILGIIKILHK